ncbi:MAG TPA: CoA transferase [Dehalococcoidia bacterium]
MPGPLAGVRVVEFTQIIAGPFGGMLLADLGAEIIKVEPPEGEPWRHQASAVRGESRNFHSLNRGKRDLVVDLSRPEARPVVERLARWADAAIINYRPGTAERLGIDYETLARLNPRLIYCENTAFGRRGPLAGLAGYDLIVQAASGQLVSDGKARDGVPAPTVPAVADFSAGILIALGVTAALYHRKETGRGQRVDVSLLGAALAVLTNQWNYQAAVDVEWLPGFLEELNRLRREGRPYEEMLALRQNRRAVLRGQIYYRVYQTRDSFVAVACLSNALRARFLQVTGLQDPRFQDPGRADPTIPFDELGPRLVEEAEALFRTRTTDEWIEAFQAAGIPVGPVRFPEELWDDPQILANDLVVEFDHPALGPFKMAGPPLRFSETPVEAGTPSPTLGQHTDEVLRSLGFDDEAIQGWRDAGVVR